MLFTKKFWADAIERIVSSTAEAELAMIGTNTAGVVAISGKVYLAVGVGTAVVATLKCLAATQVGATGTASMLPAPPTPAPTRKRAAKA